MRGGWIRSGWSLVGERFVYAYILPMLRAAAYVPAPPNPTFHDFDRTRQKCLSCAQPCTMMIMIVTIRVLMKLSRL
jgi:hypothetical protein